MPSYWLRFALSILYFEKLLQYDYTEVFFVYALLFPFYNFSFGTIRKHLKLFFFPLTWTSKFSYLQVSEHLAFAGQLTSLCRLSLLHAMASQRRSQDDVRHVVPWYGHLWSRRGTAEIKEQMAGSRSQPNLQCLCKKWTKDNTMSYSAVWSATGRKAAQKDN